MRKEKEYEGPKCLQAEPYKVFQMLKQSGTCGKLTAGALFYVFFDS